MHMQRMQFRHPLPPNVRPQVPGQVRMMMGPGPSLDQMRPGGQPVSLHTVGNQPRAGKTVITFVHQGMMPRARMIMQQPHGDQMNQLQGPPGLRPPMTTTTSDASPLLSEHLAGGRPPQDEQGDQQPNTSNEELEGLDSVPNELGDLGMGEEDLLGMGDNFDIFEFADALDDLENLPEGDPKKSSGSGSSSEPTSGTDTVTTATPATQPPPYTTAPTPTGVTSSIRAPPPPYPGHQGGPAPVTSKVNILASFLRQLSNTDVTGRCCFFEYCFGRIQHEFVRVEYYDREKAVAHTGERD